MTAFIKLKWNEFRQKLLNGRNSRRNDQLIQVKSVRERSISILQKRYGYSREEAIYQLDKNYSKARLG
jgi:hypothetical protein